MKVILSDTKLEKFVQSLEPSTIAKGLRTMDLLEMFGNSLGLPHSKKVRKNLYELRVRGKQEVRIFYIQNRNGATLLHGFIKKTPGIPRRELKVALQKLKTLES